MNKNDCIIRKETEKDYRETENLAREAFWNLSVPGCSEHYFVHMMRSHEDFIPELDYVIEHKCQIIGCIMYTKSLLRDEMGKKSLFSLWDRSVFIPIFSAGDWVKCSLNTPLRLP